MKFRTVGQRKIHLLSHVQEPSETEITEKENPTTREAIDQTSTLKPDKINHSNTKENTKASSNKLELESIPSVIETSHIKDNQKNDSIEDESLKERETGFLTFTENDQLVTNLEFNYLLDNGFITIQSEDLVESTDHLPTSTTSPPYDSAPQTNVQESSVTPNVVYTEPDSTITENNNDLENCVLLQMDDVDSTVPFENEKVSSKQLEPVR